MLVLICRDSHEKNIGIQRKIIIHAVVICFLNIIEVRKIIFRDASI